MNETHENVVVWSAIAFVIAACFVSLAILFTLAVKGMSVRECPKSTAAPQTEVFTPSYFWKAEPKE